MYSEGHLSIKAEQNHLWELWALGVLYECIQAVPFSGEVLSKEKLDIEKFIPFINLSCLGSICICIYTSIYNWMFSQGWGRLISIVMGTFTLRCA